MSDLQVVTKYVTALPAKKGATKYYPAYICIRKYILDVVSAQKVKKIIVLNYLAEIVHISIVTPSHVIVLILTVSCGHSRNTTYTKTHTLIL